MRAKPLVMWGLLGGVFTLPATTLALGLGKLTVDSNLGQPLSAHVELTAAQKDELDSLSARVADPSVYRDNNVQYPGVLSRARVVIERSANGPPQLKVTTSQAVNDPYLDLIVEVNWATGRVVRNYTFLLDPPGMGQAQAVAPPAAVRSEGAPRQARTEAAPRSAPSAPAAASPAPSGAGDTYTVRRGDTLSKIAKAYKPETVNLEQMLVALFRSNERAFDGRNMNRLRSGQILTIPSADQAAGVTPSEARQVVHVQAADWRAYRDRVAAAAVSTEPSGSRQAASGKITTAVEDKAVPAQPGKDQLRVSREAGKGGAGAAYAQAEEQAANEKALREANSRIAELEKTLKDMQHAAEFKSQAMSELQKQAEAGTAKAPESPKAAVPQAPMTPSPATTPSAGTPPAAVTPPGANAPVEKAVEETRAEAAKVPAANAPETKASETPAEPPKAAETTPPEPAPPAATRAAEVPKAKAAVKAPPKREPSFFEDLLGNTPTWAIGAAALGIVALIAGLIAARRRTATKFEDSIISGTDIKTNTVFGSTGGGVVNTGDNSLSSDFSREGLGSIDTDEVDPIAEAEVYLAYGRDAQAEEILKEALKKDSQRQEIYLKLLEIHAQHNKPSAFETVATELYSVSGGQGEVWQKAMALGRQLDPGNPLFAEAGGTPAVAEAAATGTEDAVPQEPQKPAASAQVFAMPSEPRMESKPKELDFSLDDDISLSPTSGPISEMKTPAAILAGAAQEVAKSTRGTEPMARSVAAAADESHTIPGPGVSFEPESIPKFDLDFNLEEPSRPGPTLAPIPPIAPAVPESASRPSVEPALATVAAAPAPQLARPSAAEIGRASCRERVYGTV